MTDLQTIHRLCPDTSVLELKGENIDIDFLSKFKELKMLDLGCTSMEASLFIKYLKSLNENKLTKIIFCAFQETNEKEIIEIYKLLFEKTNLTELDLIPIFRTEKVSHLIAAWIESNFHLQRINLLCKFFKINSQSGFISW
jgi:hypothetical protein